MTQLTGLSRSLLFSILTIVFVVQMPIPGYTEESSTKADQVPIPELELIKEEETVSVASRHEQPISQALLTSITFTTCRPSAAADLPLPFRAHNSELPGS